MRSRMVTLVAVVLAPILLLASKCNVDTKDITRATANVKSAAEDLQHGMDAVSKLDPAGINKLLNENAELRHTVELIEQKLAAARPGVPTLGPQRTIVFEILSYGGSLTLDGWIGSPERAEPLQKFLNQLRLTDQDVTLDLSPKRRRKEALDKKQALAADTAWIAIATAEDEFKNYLKSPYHLPTPDSDKIHNIDLRLPSSGIYGVWLGITPDAASASNNWHLKYRVSVVSPLETKQILAGEINSGKRAGWEVGKPLAPELLGSFRVEVPQE
jgi:hypothetical protein